MILRRIAAAFRRQDWFTVFVETMIVVLGVFLGLQVNNWNAARADRVQAQEFLERISADLDADIATYEDRLDFWKAVADYGAQGLAYAETGEARGASQWELLLAFFQSSQVAEFFETRTTYDELKSAGEIGLIADTRLRNDLAQYYSLGTNPAMTERPAYRQHVRGVIPLGVQTYVWENCYASDIKSRQRMLPCAAPIEEAAAAAIVDAIRGDAALMAELRYWMSTMTVAAQVGSDRLKAANELNEAVTAALGADRAAGAIDIAWIRRTRIGGDSWEGEDVPRGEANERYRVEIHGPTGLVRSADSAATLFAYTASMIASDFPPTGFPAGRPSLTIRVALLSDRVGPGDFAQVATA